MAFAHLHVHSTASDGLATPYALAQAAKRLGQSCLALTDHGTLAGHDAFMLGCHEQQIIPILGCELKVTTPLSGAGHQLVLAYDVTGYEKLKSLIRRWRPLQLGDLAGIGLVTSACRGGVVAKALARHDFYAAKDAVYVAKSILAHNYVLEIQPSFGPLLPWYFAVADALGVACVVTNDVHYLLPEHAQEHGQPGLHLASEAEMRGYSKLPGYQLAIDNTARYAQDWEATNVA